MIGALRSAVRVARSAPRIGAAEFRSDYTPASWLFGWMTRLVFQVLFFSLIGRAVGGPDVTRYLVVGNSVAVGALEASLVIVSLVNDKWSGSLAFLLATPGNHVVAWLTRNLNWPLNGLFSSVVALLLSAAVLGADLPVRRILTALPAILLCTVGAYCFACWIAVVVLWHPGASIAALNVTYLSLMVFTGVNVPTSAWPRPIEVVTQVLPLTHGLAAVRQLLDGAAVSSVLGEAGLEAVVAAGWLAVAALLARRMADLGRRDGTVDFGA